MTQERPDVKEFQKLVSEYALIRLRGKRPVEKDWQEYCHKRREFAEIGFQPGDNAGIACGPASGVIVLDIDDIELFDAAYKHYGWIVPKTRVHQTGSGKWHVLFRYPNNGLVYGNKAFKKMGFDIRGCGGQIVAPGSIHPDTGKPYTVLKDLPLAPAPEWLLKLYDEEPVTVMNETASKQVSGWDGKIEHLPVRAETKQMILSGVTVGERSEAIMTVCNALVWSNLTDAQIFSVFDRYPIGEKYRQKGAGKEKWLQEHIKKARLRVSERAKPPAGSTDDKKELPTDWSKAIQLFPATPFPWEVLPHQLAASLKQLARSCASSPASLSGVVFCILSSALGRAIAVSPKLGWAEPAILWIINIRPSGTGKSPAGHELASVLYQKQAKEYARWQLEDAEYRRLPKKERDQTTPPIRPRGYFATDLTLEGLRDDLADHITGGIVVVQDEVSAFISGQNQYKQRGTDREAWLALWDGKPARVVRKDRTIFMTGARVSVFGGIQPGVFAKVFKKNEDGLYLVDGTIFRFLPTCEDHQFFELTPESWTPENRKVWEDILNRALLWADRRIESSEDILRSDALPTQNMVLNDEAQSFFFDWRNDRQGYLSDLPPQLQGFLPKAYGYALRLAGIIHCLHRFDRGKDPDTILGITDIQRGIEVVEFYLGQTVEALQVLEDEEHKPENIDERVLHLARVLDSLQADVDSGRLAVGYVHERFNADIPKQQRIRTSKAMGALLRSVGLTVSDTRHRANGRGGYCLVWNERTSSFVERSSRCSQSSQRVAEQGPMDENIENQSSRCSHDSCEASPHPVSIVNFENLSSQQPGGSGSKSANVVNIANAVSSEREILAPESVGEVLI